MVVLERARRQGREEEVGTEARRHLREREATEATREERGGEREREKEKRAMDGWMDGWIGLMD